MIVRQLKNAAAGRERPEAPAVDGGATGVPTQSMSSAVLTGFGWKLVTIGVSEVVRVTVAVVLARLLTPADYGVAGMAFVFAGLATLFSDLALGGALVQRRDISEEDRSTVFWASLAFSVVVMAVVIALSPLVAGFFGQPEVEKLVIGLSFSIPLAALSTTQVALLTRNLSYRALEIRQISGVLCGAAAAIPLAAAGFGPWAIVGNTLVVSAASTFLLWRLSPWRPRRVFSFTHLGHLSGFGLRLFGLRLLNYANLNGDNLLVGRFAGATALGTYSLGYNVMFTPLVRIANPISGVVYPALARMQDDLPRMRKAWIRSKRLSASLLAPAFLIILVTAPDLVHVLFGQKWHAAVPVIQLLALAGVAHSLVTLNWTVLQGTGRMRVALRLDFLVTVLTVGSFVVGVRWGAVGVAAAYAAIKWPLVIIDTYVTTRALRFSFREAILAGGSILPLALLAAAAAWAVRVGLVGAGVPAAVRLPVVVATMIVLYALLLFAAEPALIAEGRHVLGRRFPRLARPLPAPIEKRLARARAGESSERERPSGYRSYGYRPSTLQERLLVVALGDPDGAVDAWKALPDGFSLDHRHELEPGAFELMPLVYRNLSQTVHDDLRLERLKGIYRRSWVKNNMLVGTTSEIAEELRVAGVPALFLEGVTVGLRFYGDVALRPTNAIHLFVGPWDVGEAAAALARRGWIERPEHGRYPAWRILYDGSGNMCVLRSALAFDFVGGRGGLAETPVWEEAEGFDVGKTEVLVPTPTDALLAACVAGARHTLLPPTQWLVDAAMILRGPELDWDRLVELAVTRGQRIRMREALGCIGDLPIVLPERVADARAWLGSRAPGRRERLGFALSSGSLARAGGPADALAELLAVSPEESLARTALRLPAHLRARWGLAHSWQLPYAAGRRALAAARRV